MQYLERKETKMPTKKKSKSTVNSAGNYTKPTLRKRLFNSIKAGTKGVAISNMKRIKEFMIKMMDKINKVYAKLFKKCLTPKKNVKSKKVTKKS